MTPNYKNVTEQIDELSSAIRPENMDALLNKDLNNPVFENRLGQEKPRDNLNIDWGNEPIRLDPQNPEYNKMKGRYEVGKIENEIKNRTYNPNMHLDKDMNSPVWQKLEEKYTKDGNRPVVYSDLISINVLSAQGEIKQGSEYWNVAPEAVTACMLDENTAIAKRGFIPDLGQDLAAQSPILSRILNKTDDWPLKFFYLDRIIPPNKAYRSAEDMEKFLNGTQTDDDRYYLVAPQKGDRMWDVGDYNINMAVGYKCFERYVLNKNEENPIYKATMLGLSDGATKEEKWMAFLEKCFVDSKKQALVVSAVLKDGESQLKAFIEERRRINFEEFPEGCYSPEEFNCLVVDTYKKGLPLMKKQYLERVKNGDLAPMKAGPGAGLIINREMINDCLTQPTPLSPSPKVQRSR